MRDVQALAKKLGRKHALASQLWTTGWYEARLLAAYVDEPAKIIRRITRKPSAATAAR